MDKRATALSDRKLGSAWRGWDGDVEKHESALNEHPGLYFFLLSVSFSLLTILLLGGAMLLWVGLRAPALAMSLGLAGSAILWLPLFICLGAIYFRLRFLAFPWLVKLLTLPVELFAFLFRPFGISRDRISSSCISINNLVTRLRLDARAQVRPMVLLPRCLSKEAFQEIKDISASFDCPVFFAGTNAQARQKVHEFRPTSIIAVACERDLVRGLYDYGRHIPILVIPNQRPIGPCAGATIEMDHLRRALEDIAGARRQSGVQSPESGRKTN